MAGHGWAPLTYFCSFSFQNSEDAGSEPILNNETTNNSANEKQTNKKNEGLVGGFIRIEKYQSNWIISLG